MDNSTEAIFQAPDAQNAPGALPAGAQRMGPTGWMVLRDYRTLTGKDVKAIRAAISRFGTGQSMVDMQEKAAELLVTNWSRSDLPLPAVPAVTDRLTAPETSALFAAMMPVVNMVTGVGVAPVLSQAAMDDPASPSGPSSE